MTPETTWNKPTALVTGAGGGIGQEVARQLAMVGMTVLLTARDSNKARAAADSLRAEGLSVDPEVLDVAQDGSVRELAGRIDRRFGTLDVLVNNAAAYVDWSETASTADLQAVRSVMETNLFGAWRTYQALLPLLRRSPRGRIVNVSSGAGSYGDPHFGLKANQGMSASYGISKAALNALTVKMASELAGTGILVNAVCPGLTATAPGMEAMGAQPIPAGASGVVWAATLPDDGPSGGFFRHGLPLPW